MPLSRCILYSASFPLHRNSLMHLSRAECPSRPVNNENCSQEDGKVMFLYSSFGVVIESRPASEKPTGPDNGGLGYTHKPG